MLKSKALRNPDKMQDYIRNMSDSDLINLCFSDLKMRDWCYDRNNDFLFRERVALIDPRLLEYKSNNRSWVNFYLNYLVFAKPDIHESWRRAAHDPDLERYYGDRIRAENMQKIPIKKRFI